MKIGTHAIFKKRPRPLIGIDIGSHTIKLVELSGWGLNRRLRRLGRALVPKNAIVDGAVREPEALEYTLKALIENCQPKLRRGASSVSGYSVIVKKIKVPYDNERDIEENLIFEAENYVPFEIEEVYLDFNLIGPSKTPKSEKGSEIFLVAAKKEVVDSYADLLQNSGIRPAVIDVDGFAIGNAFEGAKGVIDDSVVLMDIGATKSTFSIIKAGMPLFTRDMAIGGGQITKSIGEALGIEFSEAESLKIRGINDPVITRDVSRIVKDYVEEWAHEVRKAIEFFKSNSEALDAPKALYLTGGCSLLRGICDVFEDIIGIETKRFDPFCNMDKDDKIDRHYLSSVAPQFAIATGLAIRVED